MRDWFLYFMLWSVLPIALPIATPAWLMRPLAVAWLLGQWILLVLGFGAVVRGWFRAQWPTRILLASLALLTLLLAFGYYGLAWDAQAVYDRVAHLLVQYRGWRGYEHGGTNWIVGYPPGSSLSVAWGIVLGLPTSNVSHVVVTFLWLSVWLLKYVAATGLQRSGYLFVTLFFLATAGTLSATPLWHYMYFYNNLAFALVWTTLVFVALMRQPMKPWEQLGYALILVWLRPVLAIAVLPILSSALISVLRGAAWRRASLIAAGAVALQFAGVAMWNAKCTALTRALENHQSDIRDRISAAAAGSPVLGFDVATGPSARPIAVKSSESHAERAIGAIAWSLQAAWSATREAILLLVFCGIAACALGWRSALCAWVPLGNLLALVLGSGIFALGYRSYRDNLWAWQRLLVLLPVIAAALVVWLDAELTARRKTQPRLPDPDRPS